MMLMMQHVLFFVFRYVPSIFACMLVYCWVFLDLLEAVDSQLGESRQANYLLFFWHSEALLYEYRHSAYENITSFTPKNAEILISMLEFQSRMWTQRFVVWCILFFSLGASNGITNQWNYIHIIFCGQARNSMLDADIEGGVKYRLPHRHNFNYAWLLVLSLVIAVELFSFSASQPMNATMPPIGLVIFALIWPIFILFVDILLKGYDKQRLKKINQRLRIMFDTKLGMYSPR